ncbi:MAG TPA: TetR/AcrR family transcriptional regulator [Vicinamibacterales bacterium]|nr:TetR/AcrR family transcriptional regulator [Vicinamibacterales bacterium]
MRESGEGQPAARRRKRVRARRSATTATTRVEILKNAAAAFRRVGYHGASVEEIASALGMKKGNLYYYFRNKEEILFACHQYSLDQLLSMIEEVESRDLVPAEQLRRVIVGAVHLILDELHGTALFLDLEALTPAHLKAVIARRDRFDQGVRRILHECLGSGRFDPSDAKLTSFALLGAINWIPRWYSPDGPATSQEIADRFADYLLAGLTKT